jgi:uncharacterized delta-60 repeat protein
MRPHWLSRFVVPLVLVNMTLTVTAALPSIDYQPQSQAVILYQQAAFGVIASGTPPLSFQWRKDGAPITGATNDQIVLAHPQFSDAGTYSVIVSNAASSVTSASAGLTVNAPKAGDLDYSFAWGGSINGLVRSGAQQPDGKVLIAGEFSTVHGAMRGGIARLNADGTTDYTFSNLNGLSGSLYTIYSLAVQSDGKVIIGGWFKSLNGVGRTNIARLNADGTLDASFRNGLAGTDGIVQSVAAQSDGKVLIGGGFSTVDGVSRNGIARLNADGTLDSGSGGALSGLQIRSCRFVVQNDGKLLIGGSFAPAAGYLST